MSAVQTIPHAPVITPDIRELSRHGGPGLRLLPEILARESAAIRWTWFLVAITVCALYLGMLLQFWAPAHPGVDQNGYLAGGRAFSKSLTTAYNPPDDFSWVARMYVRAESGTNYPKYPLGLPILVAGCFWVLGETRGAFAAHLISPVCASLALLGLFFLTRRLAGSFLAVCAMLVLGFGQVMLLLAVNPNSHAAAVCFGVWGIYLLLRFWQTGSLWVGLLAGFVLGYCYLIRYTEGLLLLPLLFVFGSMVQSFQPAGVKRLMLVAAAWAIPVGYQTIFNYVAMNAWTSYANTNESTGFTLNFFNHNFERMTRTLHDMGLFLFFPLGLLGIGLMFARHARAAALLALWFLPSVLVYTAYYWSPESGVAYARFFLTQFPPIIAAAMWLVGSAAFSPDIRTGGAIVARVSIGLLTAYAAGVGVMRCLGGFEAGSGANPRANLVFTARDNMNLAALGRWCRKTIPAGSVVFADDSRLHHFQFIADWSLFANDYFDQRGTGRLLRRQSDGEDDPDPIDPSRVEFLKKVLDGRSAAELLEEKRRIIRDAHASAHRVFAVLPADRARQFEQQLRGKEFQTRLVEDYADLPLPRTAAEFLPPDQLPREPIGRIGRPMGRPPGPAGNTPQQWHVIEVLRAIQVLPSTQPAEAESKTPA